MSRNYFIPYFDPNERNPVIPTVGLGVRGQDSDYFRAVVSTERPTIVLPVDLARSLHPTILAGQPSGIAEQFEIVGGKRTRVRWATVTVWIFDELDRSIEWETVAAISQTAKKCYLGNALALNYLQPRFRSRGMEVQLTSDFTGQVTPRRR